MKKSNKLLLGDEALALGAINAGLSGAYAYPGTPSTEIMEFVQKSQVAREREIHSHWSSNEKTAYEEALGMSYCGKRSLVAMKHVGLNVAADPFMNSAMTGANGGMLVISADDPGMHSSQNEQDSRFYADFAMLPLLEPRDQQMAYDMMPYAFRLSEEQGLPVVVRMVTRLSHSRAKVAVNDIPDSENPLHYPATPRQWVLMPAVSKERNKVLVEQFSMLSALSENSPYNSYTDAADRSLGIVVAGIAGNYLEELYPGGIPFPTVVISQYPLPKGLLAKLADECESILVIEEGQPFIENKIRGVLPSKKRIYGKLTGELARTGELNPDLIKKALISIAGAKAGLEEPDEIEIPDVVRQRPPALCQGCGHRDVYRALNEVLDDYRDAKVFGDIGCYTLGFLAPFNALHTCVDMGASITMAKGAADAGQHPAVAIIGDSTFTHSGMTGLLDAVNEDSNITVIISDNLTTGMTGGQDSQGTGKLEEICLGLGVPEGHLHTIGSHPNNIKEMRELFSSAISHKGLSVIISRRECIQTARRHAKK